MWRNIQQYSYTQLYGIKSHQMRIYKMLYYAIKNNYGTMILFYSPQTISY